MPVSEYWYIEIIAKDVGYDMTDTGGGDALLGNAQVCVHVAKLTGMPKRSPHMAHLNDSSSLRCSKAGHASGSISSSRSSNMTLVSCRTRLPRLSRAA